MILALHILEFYVIGGFILAAIWFIWATIYDKMNPKKIYSYQTGVRTPIRWLITFLIAMPIVNISAIILIAYGTLQSYFEMKEMKNVKK